MLSYFRGTKGFIIEVGESANGPWTKMVEGEFADPAQEEGITEFPLSRPQRGQFVKFTCVSWYRYGCMLQYIGFGLNLENTGKHYGCKSYDLLI